MVKAEEEQQLGFCGSDVDGEVAHQVVKSKVEDAFAKYNNVDAQLPTVSSPSLKRTTVSSKNNIESQKKLFVGSSEWTIANTDVAQSRFDQLPAHIDNKYATCFLLSVAELAQNSVQY